jgi:hypothetical protein
MKVYAFESAGWIEAEQHGFDQKSAIEAIETGLTETQRLLPTLSNNLNIVVRPHIEGIIPEYGTGARTWDAEFIEIWFDKTIPHGAKKTLESMYQTVFHEGNHAARWNNIDEDYRLLESAVFEGLATVFEREYAGHQPLYAIYENDAKMKSWLDEIISAGSDWDKREALFFNHEDGRRWIGYKTGTWLIDTAIKKSSKSVMELTTMHADDVIQLAGL